jgi:hypothetical protein
MAPDAFRTRDELRQYIRSLLNRATKHLPPLGLRSPARLARASAVALAGVLAGLC